ncbi:ATP-binding protein [Acinetobacter baumannii]|uniref:ATP-binding protein n=1 Tax=Acinetobacter baumannii TaxID=470 RepID=UPI003EE1EE00
MGVMTDLYNEYECSTHGKYRKFKLTGDSTCPFCAKEVKESENSLECMEIQNHISVQSVRVGCEIHGYRQVQVPQLISASVDGTCYECNSSGNQKALNEAISLRIHEEYKKAKLPKNSINLTFEELDTSKSAKQKLIIQALIKEIQAIIAKGSAIDCRNILLSGSMGAGKTAMASIFLQNIIKRSVKCTTKHINDIYYENKLRCAFITESQLINDIQETWKKDCRTTTKEIYNHLSHVPILCIDDVGSLASSSYLFEAYTTILDARYKLRLPTLITSNIAYTELEKLIGSRSADRFLESGRILVVNCDWQSYRQSNAIEVI